MITNSLNCPSMPDTITDVALRTGCFSEVHGQGIACFPKPGNLCPAFTFDIPKSKSQQFETEFRIWKQTCQQDLLVSASFLGLFRIFFWSFLVFWRVEFLGIFGLFFSKGGPRSHGFAGPWSSLSVVLVVKDNYGHHMIQFEFSPKTSVWRIPPTLPLVAPKWPGFATSWLANRGIHRWCAWSYSSYSVDHLAEVHLLMRDVDISPVSPSVLWSTWYPPSCWSLGSHPPEPIRTSPGQSREAAGEGGIMKGRAASTSPGYRGKSWRLVTGWQRANEEIVPSALSLSPAGMWMSCLRLWVDRVLSFFKMENLWKMGGKNVWKILRIWRRGGSTQSKRKATYLAVKTASVTVTKTQISILEPLTTQDLQAP